VTQQYCCVTERILTVRVYVLFSMYGFSRCLSNLVDEDAIF
jgi:hypothetical protein